MSRSARTSVSPDPRRSLRPRPRRFLQPRRNRLQHPRRNQLQHPRLCGSRWNPLERRRTHRADMRHPQVPTAAPTAARQSWPSIRMTRPPRTVASGRAGVDPNRLHPLTGFSSAPNPASKHDAAERVKPTLPPRRRIDQRSSHRLLREEGRRFGRVGDFPCSPLLASKRAARRLGSKHLITALAVGGRDARAHVGRLCTTHWRRLNAQIRQGTLANCARSSATRLHPSAPRLAELGTVRLAAAASSYQSQDTGNQEQRSHRILQGYRRSFSATRRPRFAGAHHPELRQRRPPDAPRGV